jgi:DNA-binding CsgD family transcriptional regulator
VTERASGPAIAPSSGTAPAGVGRGRLLGELTALVDRFLLQKETTGSSLVVLDGLAGVGKSTLLDAVGSVDILAGAPVAVLSVSGVEWESAARYALLQQLLPELHLHADRGQLELAAQVATALRQRGAGSTLILVDNADLADPSSLQVLVSAVRHHRDAPLLVILTRTIGTAGPATDILSQGADRIFTLEPFNADEVSELASRAGIVLHRTLAEHLTRHTGGRPAHLASLLASEPPDTWQGIAPDLPAPAAVEAAARTSMKAMHDATRALLHAVAVLGPQSPLALAARLAAVTDPLAAIDEAERSGLLRRRGSGVDTVLSMRDEMVASAVRSLMGAAEEARLHRLASEYVEDPAHRLEHAVGAAVSPDADLATRVHALARTRVSEGAWRSAASLFLLASRASSDNALRGERLLLAVDALVGAGDIPAAGSYLAEIESLPETAMRNAVLGYLAILRGRATEADSRLTRAWHLESGTRHPDVAATIAQRHVLHHLARCDGANLVMWADRTVDLVGEDHPTAVEAQAIRGLGLGSTGRLQEALESYRSLWEHASRGAVGQRVQMGAGWLHLAADEVDLARSELSTATPTDFLGGSTRISLWAHAWLARTQFVTGEWDQAMGVATTGLDIADRAGITLLEPLLRWTCTQIHALRGESETALRSSMAGATPGDYEIMRIPTCLGRAAVAEARADYAGVLSALDPLTRQGMSPDLAEPGFWPWPDVYANALVLEGRLEEAGEFLDHHEQTARDRQHRSARARLGYARGRWHGARGDLPAARSSFDAALGLLEGLPLVYDRARVNFAYGQTLRRAGKRRDADVVITAAREDYATLGATTYVLRCERELKAGGVRAVLRDRPAESLTPQEKAVAGLVAQGLRNREVAAELYLSVKTVQFHLTRVYAKLGIRSRVELAALPPSRLEETGS